MTFKAGKIKKNAAEKTFHLDEGMLALLKWLEGEGFSLAEIYQRILNPSAFGAVSLQGWGGYQRFKIKTIDNDQKPKMVANIMKNEIVISDLAIQINAGIIPETIIDRICGEKHLPANEIVDHPYLTGATVKHTSEDSKYLIILLNRKLSDYVLSAEGIKPRENGKR